MIFWSIQSSVCRMLRPYRGNIFLRNLLDSNFHPILSAEMIFLSCQMSVQIYLYADVNPMKFSQTV